MANPFASWFGMRDWAWSEWGIWSYTATATQSNVAGGTILIDITAGLGNIIEILYATAVGTFAAADTVDFFLFDEDNNTLGDFSAVGAAAGVTTSFPRMVTNIDSNSSTRMMTGVGVLAGSDLKFSALTSALAQNDTVAILLVAKVKNGPGMISVARSGGTVAAPTVTVNEVY